uniref:Voltage-dependent calcium channel alpha-2/delta subunit conserved region domain-containing protein n=1 Tax=Tetranychus urticae TaxID=32264 RepID=T1KVS2_TETUR
MCYSTVDSHRFNSSAFVFSVPFDAGDKPGSTHVTGSRAIFLGKGKSIAPVAAVGLLFRHDKFAERFFNFSSLCKTEGCNVNCSTDAFDCFLVDNNGFVVVSKRSNETGKFYGEVDYPMFEVMVSQGIYKEIKCTITRPFVLRLFNVQDQDLFILIISKN